MPPGCGIIYIPICPTVVLWQLWLGANLESELSSAEAGLSRVLHIVLSIYNSGIRASSSRLWAKCCGSSDWSQLRVRAELGPGPGWALHIILITYFFELSYFVSLDIIPTSYNCLSHLPLAVADNIRSSLSCYSTLSGILNWEFHSSYIVLMVCEITEGADNCVA